MKLITPEIQQRFEKVGNQENTKNPLVIAKFFSPVGGATWYATEYNPETNICYGYVKDLVPSENGIYDEWGYFSISELASLTLPFGLKIERDLHFNEIKFNELISPKPKKRKIELRDISNKKTNKTHIER